MFALGKSDVNHVIDNEYLIMNDINNLINRSAIT